VSTPARFQPTTDYLPMVRRTWALLLELPRPRWRDSASCGTGSSWRSPGCKFCAMFPPKSANTSA